MNNKLFYILFIPLISSLNFVLIYISGIESGSSDNGPAFDFYNVSQYTNQCGYTREVANSLVRFFISVGSNRLYLYNGTVYFSVSGSADRIYTYNTVVIGNSITGSKDYVYSS